jgi:hypothetical protein
MKKGNCFFCGNEVPEDHSRYSPKTGITWFNRCDDCAKLGKTMTEQEYAILAKILQALKASDGEKQTGES